MEWIKIEVISYCPFQVSQFEIDCPFILSQKELTAPRCWHPPLSLLVAVWQQVPFLTKAPPPPPPPPGVKYRGLLLTDRTISPCWPRHSMPSQVLPELTHSNSQERTVSWGWCTDKLVLGVKGKTGLSTGAEIDYFGGNTIKSIVLKTENIFSFFLSFFLKPIFHCDPKSLALGNTPDANFSLGIPKCWYLEPTRTLKFTLPPTRNLKFVASQWNIGCVGSQRKILALAMYISCFFVLISFALGIANANPVSSGIWALDFSV